MTTRANIILHIVFSTRYRRPDLDGFWVPDLYEKIRAVLREEHVRVLALNGIEDHIHILIAVSATTRLPDVIRRAKAISSRWINQRRYVSRTFRWQRGYGVFSVSSRDVEPVRRYIERQREHHHPKFTVEHELDRLDSKLR